MDYKKAYYSLIERLKEAKEDADVCDERYCCVIDGLIREPEESERIRKAISQCVEDMRGQFEKLYSVHHKDAIAWLEKQRDQEEPQVYETEDGDIITYSETDGYKVVERKFKVGDYIVNDYCVGKVMALTDDVYLLDSEQGIPFSYEHNAHLWTIQDAKPGDVLAFDDDTIVIFKDLYNATTFHSYCYIEDGVFNAGDDEAPDWWEGKNFYPATKEQRDHLFQKMREAGYEWDAEKKELKNIETIGIPFSAKDSELIETTYFIPEGFHAEIDDDKVIIKKGKQRPADKDYEAKRKAEHDAQLTEEDALNR